MTPGPRGPPRPTAPIRVASPGSIVGLRVRSGRAPDVSSAQIVATGQISPAARDSMRGLPWRRAMRRVSPRPPPAEPSKHNMTRRSICVARRRAALVGRHQHPIAQTPADARARRGTPRARLGSTCRLPRSRPGPGTRAPGGSRAGRRDGTRQARVVRQQIRRAQDGERPALRSERADDGAQDAAVRHQGQGHQPREQAQRRAARERPRTDAGRPYRRRLARRREAPRHGQAPASSTPS